LKIRVVATIAAVMGLAIVPASALAAPSLRLNKACYGALDTLVLTGAGYVPGSQVTLTISGQQAAGTRTIDAAGGFTYSTPTPQVTTNTRLDLLEVKQADNPAFGARVQAKFARTKVALSPLRSRPGKRSRIRAAGFTLGPRTLRAHIKRTGRYKNLRIGRLKGACGTIKTKKRLFKRSSPTGVYRVIFDTARRYSANTPQQAGYLFTIFRTLVPSSASGGLLSTTAERWRGWGS
jgi:hypothetical protein